MTTSLRIVRSPDGTVSYEGALPERHTFSSRYIENGGNAAIGEARAHQAVIDDENALEDDKAAAREALDGVNLEPLFARDGADIIFDFPEGPVRYRFVGFETNSSGDLNHAAPIFELVK